MKVNSSIIRIVGLLGEIPEKSADKLFQKFRDAGYHRDLYPVDTNGAKDGRSLQWMTPRPMPRPSASRSPG